MPYKKVVYFASWSIHRRDEAKFDYANIDPSLFTHAIYAFIGVNLDGTIRVRDPINDIDNGGFAKFVALKERSTDIKMMVAIGGWEEGCKAFSTVAASPDLRREFSSNMVHFMKKYGFDGLDIDWEYPTYRGGIPEDKANFSLLLQELRKAFDGNGKQSFLLSAAVAAISETAHSSYDAPALCKYLDFINVMTYDFHGAFDGRTGHNAPLYPSPESKNRLYNIDDSMKAWLGRGAIAEKINLGLPMYGRSFTVDNPDDHDINNPATAGEPGPLVNSAGVLLYFEICYLKQEGNWNQGWDDTQKVPYMYKANQWVSFDDAQSIQLKVDYMKMMRLGGVMVWTMDGDDFRNGYPLLTKINELLSN